jgi:hypothetical protein
MREFPTQIIASIATDMPAILPTLSTTTAKGDFPRGGGSLTPLELRDIQAEAEQDLLMEDRVNENAPQQSLKQKKKHQAKKRAAEADEESAAKKLKGSSIGQRVDFLTFKVCFNW